MPHTKCNVGILWGRVCVIQEMHHKDALNKSDVQKRRHHHLEGRRWIFFWNQSKSWKMIYSIHRFRSRGVYDAESSMFFVTILWDFYLHESLTSTTLEKGDNDIQKVLGSNKDSHGWGKKCFDAIKKWGQNLCHSRIRNVVAVEVVV